MLKLEQWDRDHGAIEQNGIERLDLWLFFGGRFEEGITSSLRLGKALSSQIRRRQLAQRDHCGEEVKCETYIKSESSVQKLDCRD